MKQTPLKQSNKPMKRTRLKSVSKKKSSESARESRFRKAIFERDGYTCQICGRLMDNGSWHQDERTCSHIFTVGDRPEWRFIKENAFCACGSCHWSYDHEPLLRAEGDVKLGIDRDELRSEFMAGVGTIIE